MQDNIITWNFANWVSITLMALVGYFLIGVLVAAVKRKQGGGDAMSDPAVSA